MPSPFDDLPEVDRKSCQLLGPTALVVQGLMGVLVVLSLVYKRHRETPKRPWRIWFFDVSKQVIGQMFVHGVNVLISGVLAHVSAGNACVLYFLNILIDTTLGVAMIYFFIHLTTWFFTEKCHWSGFESGQYGTPPSISYWGRQTAVYVFSISSMKLLVVALFALWPGIFTLGEWMLSFLGSSNAAQVIFTMGLFPICMNIVQFWLIDSIVKAGAEEESLLPTDGATSYDREPLFHAGSDDDDDEDTRPHDIENPPRRRSLSRGHDDLPAECKASTHTSLTATTSGSSSPKAVDDVGSQSIAMHSYPPVGRQSTSPLSSGSLHSRASSTSPNPSSSRRRSPPPSLKPKSRAGFPAVVITSNAELPKPQPQNVVGTLIQDEKVEWDAWGDDDTVDWVDKVGEEEWTGTSPIAHTYIARHAVIT
ncbi:vacuolar membrane protein-domain-containing protein [Cristinia sonorae]|uniref:Vacuolar membrane protein-domain-containing protein n=1 Tax=Cristinia sonorae TaxID=1940300 RepID=A0A8K0UM95_9AGAR|nr:vacuolar membrane protein-domain-containing protein [Cristinia sonorae]